MGPQRVPPVTMAKRPWREASMNEASASPVTGIGLLSRRASRPGSPKQPISTASGAGPVASAWAQASSAAWAATA